MRIVAPIVVLLAVLSAQSTLAKLVDKNVFETMVTKGSEVSDLQPRSSGSGFEPNKSLLSTFQEKQLSSTKTGESHYRFFWNSWLKNSICINVILKKKGGLIVLRNGITSNTIRLTEKQSKELDEELSNLWKIDGATLTTSDLYNHGSNWILEGSVGDKYRLVYRACAISHSDVVSKLLVEIGEHLCKIAGLKTLCCDS